MPLIPHITHYILKDVPSSMYFSPICGPIEANTFLSHLLCICFTRTNTFAFLDTEAREMLLVAFLWIRKFWGARKVLSRWGAGCTCIWAWVWILRTSERPPQRYHLDHSTGRVEAGRSQGFKPMSKSRRSCLIRKESNREDAGQQPLTNTHPHPSIHDADIYIALKFPIMLKSYISTTPLSLTIYNTSCRGQSTHNIFWT